MERYYVAPNVVASPAENVQKKSCKKLHLGELMPICSIKFAEMDTAHQKLKGRTCFRGDNVKDSDGAVAVVRFVQTDDPCFYDCFDMKCI